MGMGSVYPMCMHAQLLSAQARIYIFHLHGTAHPRTRYAPNANARRGLPLLGTARSELAM